MRRIRYDASGNKACDRYPILIQYKYINRKIVKKQRLNHTKLNTTGHKSYTVAQKYIDQSINMKQKASDVLSIGGLRQDPMDSS
jgi:hypothetical protein